VKKRGVIDSASGACGGGDDDECGTDRNVRRVIRTWLTM